MLVFKYTAPISETQRLTLAAAMTDVGYIVLSAVGILGVAISSYSAAHPVGYSPLLLGSNQLWDAGFQFGTLAAIASTGIVILHPSSVGIVPVVSCVFVAVSSIATSVDARAVGTMACSQAVIFAAADNGAHWKWFIVAVVAAAIGVAASGVMVYAGRLHRRQGSKATQSSKPRADTGMAAKFAASSFAKQLGFGGGTALRHRAKPVALLGDDPFM